MEPARPPPFTPSYESGYPPSPRSYESGYPNNTPPPSAPPEFDDELVMPPIIMKPSAPAILVPSAPSESDFNDEPTPTNLIKPSAPSVSDFNDEPTPTNLMKPSAPPVSEFDEPAPPVPIIALQTLQPSAPPAEFKYFEDQLNLIEEETNNLNLALIESELEYILQEISKLDENECDKQCQETIDKIEPNTLEIFLTKNMNNIFKEK
jgi:hypothetical protein